MGRRSRSREDKARVRNRSPSPEMMRKKSLSPGTKEILAYKAEQERAQIKKIKKTKDSLYSDDEVEEIPIFVNKYRDDTPEKKDKSCKQSRPRHGSGDSHDEVERLRLQALSSLRSRDNSDQSDYKSPKKKVKTSKDDDFDDDDEEYVEKKIKKAKKKRDRNQVIRNPKIKKRKRRNARRRNLPLSLQVTIRTVPNQIHRIPT